MVTPFIDLAPAWRMSCCPVALVQLRVFFFACVFVIEVRAPYHVLTRWRPWSWVVFPVLAFLCAAVRSAARRSALLFVVLDGRPLGGRPFSQWGRCTTIVQHSPGSFNCQQRQRQPVRRRKSLLRILVASRAANKSIQRTNWADTF